MFGQNEDGTYNLDDVGIDSEGGLATADFLQEQAEAGLISADVTYEVMIECSRRQRPVRDHRTWAVNEPTSASRQPACRSSSSRSRPVEGGEPPQVFVGVQGFMVSSFSGRTSTWRPASSSTI